ncbi:hypothetical protein KQI63_00225 [bacterium]|nr:hypothetical protein [bacterium]
MLFALLILLVSAALLLSLLKLTGIVGWSWLVILKIVGYPAAFLGVLAGMVLIGVLFVRSVRALLEWREKHFGESE